MVLRSFLSLPRRCSNRTSQERGPQELTKPHLSRVGRLLKAKLSGVVLRGREHFSRLMTWGLSNMSWLFTNWMAVPPAISTKYFIRARVLEPQLRLRGGARLVFGLFSLATWEPHAIPGFPIGLLFTCRVSNSAAP